MTIFHICFNTGRIATAFGGMQPVKSLFKRNRKQLYMNLLLTVEATCRLREPDSNKPHRSLALEASCITGSNSTWIYYSLVEATCRLREPDSNKPYRSLALEASCTTGSNSTRIYYSLVEATCRLREPDSNNYRSLALEASCTTGATLHEFTTHLWSNMPIEGAGFKQTTQVFSTRSFLHHRKQLYMNLLLTCWSNMPIEGAGFKQTIQVFSTRSFLHYRKQLYKNLLLTCWSNMPIEGAGFKQTTQVFSN